MLDTSYDSRHKPLLKKGPQILISYSDLIAEKLGRRVKQDIDKVNSLFSFDLIKKTGQYPCFFASCSHLHSFTESLDYF